jgi:Mrp family chromosome partitioning ATPase
MKTNTSTPPTTKSIILVGGDKGGVGKSTVARALADYLGKKDAGFTGYDGDDTNPTFLRFFPDAVRIHTKSVKGFEPLINALESDKGQHLVDLGAGTSIVLSHFADQTGFLDLTREYGARVVILFVLAPSADSIGLLKMLSEQYGNAVSYVIARSNAIPGTWDLWDGSKARKRLIEELAAVEITIPALDAEAFSLVDRFSLRWSVAADDKRLPLASRSYIHRWLAKVFGEFDKAKLV